jgi:YD repeat-containing protein
MKFGSVLFTGICVLVIASALSGCATPTTRIPSLSQPYCGPASAPVCSGLSGWPGGHFPTLCAAAAAGYYSCSPALGRATENGENGNLGYDINAATGNLFIEHADIHARPGIGPVLNFVRYYNSQGNGADIGLGPNWTHSFSWSLSLTGDAALIVADTGRVIAFTHGQSGWIPPNGEFGRLRSDPKVSGGYLYTDRSGTGFAFDASGRLTSITAADDYPLVITYSTGRQIAQVTSHSCPLGVASPACSSMSLVFSYVGSHISGVTDPAGATWLYGYTQPLFPGLCVSSNLIACPPQLQLPASGILQTLTSVTIPNALPQGAVHGMILYAYTPQRIGITTFSPAEGTVALTGYAEITGAAPYTGKNQPQNHVTEVISGLFSYVTPPTKGSLVQVSEAASGVVSGQLLKHLQLFYGQSPANASPGATLVTTAYLNGGSKTLTSQYIDAVNLRLVSAVSTAGVGAPGEMARETWSWNPDLTLASRTDANNVTTAYGPYVRGNPSQIVEAVATPLARTTRLRWHPIMARPLSITLESAATPGCLSTGTTPCQLHQITFNYDAPPPGGIQTSPNSNPTNYLNQIIESGYTAGDLSGTLNSSKTYTVQIQRQKNHQIASIAGPVPGSLTKYDYHRSGYLFHVNRIASSSVTLTTTYNSYDSDGRVTSITDPNGSTESVTYDFAGKVLTLRLASADGTQSIGITYTRDLSESEIQRVNVDGTAVSTEYDAAERPWRRSAVPPAGIPLAGTSTVWSRVIDYDAFNRPVTNRLFSGLGADLGAGCSQATAEELCTDFGYDSFERLQTVHTLDFQDKPCTGLPANCTTTYLHDGVGNLQSVGNPVDGATTYSSDELNRTATIRTATGGLTTLVYDVNDHLIGRRDAMDAQNGRSSGNRLSTFVFDDFGNPILARTPDIGTWTSNFDAAGHLANARDATGAQLAFQYDLLGRRTAVTSVSSPADSVSYYYDQTGAMPGMPSMTFSNSLGRLSFVLASDASSSWLMDLYSYDYRGNTVADVQAQNYPSAPMPLGAIQYQWDPQTGRLNQTVYPDGLVVSPQYLTSGGYLAALQPSGVTALFNGQPINLQADTVSNMATNAAYFADGMLKGVMFGNGSTLQVTRNKRGEITNIVSGPSGNPINSQAYSYDWNNIGRVTWVNFFPNQANSWQWFFGYNSDGWLNCFSTNVRVGPTQTPPPQSPCVSNGPTTADLYRWSYDQVGNRTASSFNGSERVFSFDPAGATNQLQSASTELIATRRWGYYSTTFDANGNLSSAGISQLRYSARHHIREIDSVSDYASTTLQQNSYDGLERIERVTCPPASPQYQHEMSEAPWGAGVAPPWGIGFCGSLANAMSGATPAGWPATWHRFFYDLNDRLLEEVENNGATANGCPAYDITDHIYLADLEIARVTSQLVAPGGTSGCAPTLYQLVLKDVLYLHHDARGLLFAVESQAKGGLAWEAEVGPFGQVLSTGLPGPDGKIGTSDDVQPPTISLSPGIGAANVDGQVGFLADKMREIDPSAGRLNSPGASVWDPYGMTPYLQVPQTIGAGGVGTSDAGFGSSPVSLLTAIATDVSPEPENDGSDSGENRLALELHRLTPRAIDWAYDKAAEKAFDYPEGELAKAAFSRTVLANWFKSDAEEVLWESVKRILGRGSLSELAEHAFGKAVNGLGDTLLGLLSLQNDTGREVPEVPGPSFFKPFQESASCDAATCAPSGGMGTQFEAKNSGVSSLSGASEVAGVDLPSAGSADDAIVIVVDPFTFAPYWKMYINTPNGDWSVPINTPESMAPLSPPPPPPNLCVNPDDPTCSQ